MYTCIKCKSTKIKTRPNMSFGKAHTTIVNCKNCGSTNIENVDMSRRRRR